jgi:two-component system cell cycle response regulator DivK
MSKIVVIEDNPANQKLLTLLLTRADHMVLCAVDAESGMALIHAEQPDLVLMDIQLPGIDGLAATVLLKQDPATADIPIIALTALAMQEDREKAMAAGCDAYIAKPLRFRELYEVIDGLLSSTASKPL